MSSAESARTRLAIPGWFREVAIVGSIYGLYSIVRNQFGSARVAVGEAPIRAFNNAVRIIDIEKAIWMYHETTIQDWFLGTGWVTFFNVFYGSLHFVATFGALIWLYVRRHHNFRRWRTTLMVATVLALVGFATFPLMPPRLINVSAEENRFGGGELAIESGLPDYGFVDTLRDGKGLWTFDSKGMDEISNQYAAMPSLHIGYSLWVALVAWNFAKRWVTRIAGVLYPLVTLVTIVATANHFIIDAAGGIIIVALGYLAARGVEAFQQRRRQQAHTPT